MTISIISEAKKSLLGKQTWRFKENLLKLRIKKPFFTSQNLSDIFLYFLIFMFCNTTDRPTDKVNYILYAPWDRGQKYHE